MRYRLASLILASAAVAGGCTTAGSSPATTPPMPDTTATTTPAPVTTLTVAQTTTTTDRLLEIQAIFEDLERRRLQAIYDQDEEAFRAVYANDEYLELELESFALLDVIEPTLAVLTVERILSDGNACIAAQIGIDATQAFAGGSVLSAVIVVEYLDDSWGYSWVGEGWTCDGSHPLSQ